MNKQQMIEKVCAACPATRWGETTTCATFDRHIGRVDSCPAWYKYLADGGKAEERVQMTMEDLEPAMETLQYVEETIRSYNWMLNTISQLANELDDAGEGVVANYGDPTAGIRAQGKNSDKTLAEVARRERSRSRLNRLKATVAKFDAARASITNEQELAMLDDLISGCKMVNIAASLGVSNTRAHEIKNRLIRRLTYFLMDGEAA